MPAARRIVILGGGFGGAYCAQALERRLRGQDVEVRLIDRNNFFVFYPLLVEAGTGSLEPRHAVVATRAFLRSATFQMGEVEGLDPGRRVVRIRPPVLEGASLEVPYDHLVIALGSVTRLPDLPGLRQHAYQLKSLPDAVALRDRAIQVLELADAEADAGRRRSLLHFVVVGGNFTGAEVAGEFHVFLRHAARHYRNVDAADCRVTLLEMSDRILAALAPDLSAYAARQMQRRGIEVRCNAAAAEIRADGVILQDGDFLPAATVVWCAGIAPNPLIASLPLPVDERGYILCQPDLRIRGFDNIWGIGDAAVNPGPDGHAYPATAQHAVREAVHLADNLRRVLSGMQAVPFGTGSPGSLASIGCRTAVARVFGIKLSGFAAWFLWRTVYLMKMPGWPRRVRVALDWAVDLIFPRDFVQLGVHPTNRRNNR